MDKPDMPPLVKQFYDELIAEYMTHDQLQKMIDTATKAIRLVPAKKTKSILPVMQIVLIGPKSSFEPEHRVIGMPDAMESDETKAEAMAAVGASFADECLLPLAICFSSEAWSATYDAKNRVWEHTIGRPSNDPNRIEIAQISCLNLKMTTAFTYATVKRDAEETITEIGDFCPTQFTDEGGDKMRMLIRVYKGYHAAIMKKA